MPRTAAKLNQADIARALRAMRQTFGSAQLVFDVDGKLRVVPSDVSESQSGIAEAADIENADISKDEDFDL